MKSKQLRFFASTSDVRGLVSRVAGMCPIVLVESGTFSEPTSALTRQIQDISAGSSYLILAPDVEVVIRPVPLRSGKIRYAVDQLQNPASIVLATGASVGERLLPGQVGTASRDPGSVKLYECFAKAMRQEFTKIESSYVGTEAMKLAASGMRLSQTEKSPPEYDLRLEDGESKGRR